MPPKMLPRPIRILRRFVLNSMHRLPNGAGNVLHGKFLATDQNFGERAVIQSEMLTGFFDLLLMF